MPLAVRPQKSAVFSYAALVLCLALNAAYVIFAAQRLFLAYEDYDGFLNIAWRILIGQKIYQDFYYHSGVMFPFTMAFFLFLFGANKVAVLAELLFSSSVPIVLVFLMARKKLSAGMCAAATLLTTLTFHGDHLFPNYTQDAALWALFGVWALASGPPADARSALRAGVLCGAAAAVSALTKENTGIPCAAVFLACLMLSDFWVAAAKGFAAGAFAAFTALMLITRTSLFDYLHAVLGMEGFIAGNRLQRFFDIQTYLGNFYWIFPAVLLVPLRDEVRKHAYAVVLFLGLAGVAMFSRITGSLFGVWNHIPFWGPLFALGAIFLKDIEEETPAKRRILAISTALLVFAGFAGAGAAFSKSVEPVLSNPPGVNPIIKTAPPDVQRSWRADYDYRFKTPAFRGWYCVRHYAAPLDYFTDVVKTYVPEDQTLLIYGNLQLVYALTGRAPRYKTPVKFVPPDAPLKGEQADSLANAIRASPPDWALLKYGNVWTDNADRIDAHLGLGGFWKAHYDIVRVYKPWVLVRLRKK